MSTEHHFISNLRDLRFNLFEYLKIQHRSLGAGPFGEVDRDMMEAALEAMDKLCVGEFASSFAASDHIPLVREQDGTVRLPEPLKKTLKVFWDNDWHRFSLPPSMGGFGAPATVAWSAFELQAGANPAACFYFLAPSWRG